MTTGAGAPIRVLVAKPGFDGHDRGAKVVAKALKDAGMEVIYTGLHQTVDAIVKLAVEEDVQVLGLSYLNGTHLEYTRDIIAGLRAAGADDMTVVVGGVIARADVPKLRDLGVAEVFMAGTALENIISFIRTSVR